MAKDGREVILRTPRGEDLDDLLELINSLVDIGADILAETRFSREQEAERLSSVLTRLERG